MMQTTPAIDKLIETLKDALEQAAKLKREGAFTLPRYASLALDDVQTNLDLGIVSMTDLLSCGIDYDPTEGDD